MNRWLSGLGASRQVVVTVSAVLLALGALGFLLWSLLTRSPTRLAWLTSMATILAVVLPAWGMSVGMLAWVLRAGRRASERRDTAGTGPRQGAPLAVAVGEIPQEPPAFQRRPALEDQLAAGLAVVTAVTGGPGMGKTQLAAAVARSCIGAGWPVVAWIVAEDAGAVEGGMDQLARALGLAAARDDSAAAARKARNWLESQAGAQCLVVFDNVPDAAVVRPWLPAAGRARVIVTSTSKSCDDLGTPVRVDTFTEEQALAFLQERTGLDDDTGARALTAELGYLPLALAQAAAVVRSQRLTYATLLERITAVPADRLLLRRSGDPYPRGAAEAVLVALRAATEADRLAWPLAALAAVFSPAGTSRDLLYRYHGPGQMDGYLAEAEVDEGLGQLADASLLAFTLDGTAVLMHRFTQRVIRDRMRADGSLEDFVLAAARLVAGARPEDEADHRELCLQLISQTDVLWVHATSGAATGQSAAIQLILELRRWSTHCLWGLGSTSAAIEQGLAAVADHEEILGGDCAETIQARYGLGLAYGQRDWHDQAIALNRQVLEWYVGRYGPDDPDALNYQNTLGNNYRESGEDFREPSRLQTSIELHTKTLAQYTRIDGPDAYYTIRSGMNLVRAYTAIGQVNEAISAAEEMLGRARRCLDPADPLTLGSMAALASAYAADGRTQEALQVIGQAVATADNAPLPPITIWFLRRQQAAILARAGQTGRAIAEYKQLASAYASLLGNDSPDTRAVLEALADTYRQAGMETEALTTLETVMGICSRTLDPDSPITRRAAVEIAHLRDQHPQAKPVADVGRFRRRDDGTRRAPQG